MRTPLATLLAFGLIAAPAAAQATATATPDKAGKGTMLHTELDATQPPVSGRIPSQTTLSVQSGYRFDRRAVKKRCSTAQAQGDDCPAKSAVGTAQVVATYNGFDVMVPIRLYLAKPQQAGDLAGLAAIASVLGSTQSAMGRVVRSTEDPFGLSVILPTPGDFSSFPVTLKSFTSDIGAKRTVRKRVGKGKKRHTVTRRRNLIRNPKICPSEGTWASRAAFEFGDGSTAALDAPIACH